MRVMVLLLLALLVMRLAWANDTAVHGTSGTVTPLAGEHASIRMVHETVRLDIYPRYYDVQAEFLFHNTGTAATVTMGFPESGVGDGSARYRDRTAFQYFRTTVDGNPVTARRQPGSAPEGMSYQTWWTKEVTFAAGQQRRVTVAYRAPIGEDSMGERWALYRFTGGNWAGTVNYSRLHVRLHLNGTYAVHSTVPLLRDADSLSTVWHDWEAEETAIISFQPSGDWDLALRGLEIPRERDRLTWLSPTVSIMHLRAPGITDPGAQPFIPAAFINTDREGTAYISLWALKKFFVARRPDIPAPEFSWQDGVRFSYMETTLQFKEADFFFFQDKMHPTTPPVASANTVAPEVILVDMSSRAMTAPQPYVKAASALRAFGVGVNTDHADHLLTLHFPTPETGLVALDGKTHRVALRGNEVVVVDVATGQPRCRFANPLPSPGQTKNAFIESLTIGPYLLLLSHNDDGAVRLHGYDLATGCAAGKLSEAWQVNLHSRALLPAADNQALYLFAVTETTVAVEKRALADGAVRWRRALPGVPVANSMAFIVEQDGNVALYHARRDGDGITDPAEVILLNAENGDLRIRYRCDLDDAVPQRLPRWIAGPTATRALLNVDGQLLAATYGQGLWRSRDGKAWARVAGDGLPTHLVSLGASRQGDIAAGTYMQDGLTFRSSLDPAFRLLAWPNRLRWPEWWSREYSRCMAVGFSGDTLYVQSFGGFLRWTSKSGWERTAIPTNERVYAVINDSGIWTASADGRTVRIQHYTPTGVNDLDAPVPVQTTRIQSMTTLHGMLYLFTADGRVITCTAADLREYATALAKGHRPRWAPFTWCLLGQGRTISTGHAVISSEHGYRPVIIASTSKGPVFAQNSAEGQASAILDPSLTTYTSAFTTYRDTTGDWLVMGGKDGVVMLPGSIVRASLFAASVQDAR